MNRTIVVITNIPAKHIAQPTRASLFHNPGFRFQLPKAKIPNTNKTGNTVDNIGLVIVVCFHG